MITINFIKKSSPKAPMKLVLAEPKFFKDSITIIADLVSEAKFRVTSAGLELVAMDPANVAMVIFKLLSSSFVECKVKGTNGVEELAVNLNNLKQILRRAKNDDVVTLETTDDAKLTIQFKSNTTRSFSIPTLELDEKEQKVPELTFPISVTTSSSLLSESIDDVSVVAESVTFLGEAKMLSIKAEGDLSKAFIEINADETTVIKAAGEAKYKAKYSLEYLKKMAAAGKMVEQVSLHFNNDYPLKLDYKVTDRLLMSFILAPRVDND